MVISMSDHEYLVMLEKQIDELKARITELEKENTKLKDEIEDWGYEYREMMDRMFDD